MKYVALTVTSEMLNGYWDDLSEYMRVVLDRGFEKTGNYDLVPPRAVEAFCLSIYVSQVLNGGHYQFYVNTEMNKWLTDGVRGALSSLKLDRYAEIFSDLEAMAARYAIPHPAYSTGKAPDNEPYLVCETLDDRWFACDAEPGEKIGSLAAKWIQDDPRSFGLHVEGP